MPKLDKGFKLTETTLARTKLLRGILRRSCIIIFVLTLAAKFSGVDSELLVQPSSTIAVRGQTVRLTCSTDKSQPVYWGQIPALTDQHHWIYYGSHGFNSMYFNGRFRIDRDDSSGRYDLVISGLEASDAGTYSCADESGLGSRASAELTVTDVLACVAHMPPDGVMSYNVFGIENDLISISCSLTYSGNNFPSLEWSWLDVNGTEQFLPATTTAHNNSTTSTLKLPPRQEHNGATFGCRVPSQEGQKWESGPVVVKYAEFRQMSEERCPDFTWLLICNPPCSYHTETTTDGGCRCISTYASGRENGTHNITSDNTLCVKTEKEELLDWKATALVAVISTVVIAVFAGVIIIIVKEVKKPRKGKASTNNEQLLPKIP